MDRIFSFINEERAVLFARMSLALLMVWFGAMNFTSIIRVGTFPFERPGNAFGYVFIGG